MVTAINLQGSIAQEILFQDISWETYEALVKDLESQSGKRLTYDNGCLEIFMPLPPHERYKRWLGRFVEIVTEEMNVEILSLSACTWSRKDLVKGVEADEFAKGDGRGAARIAGEGSGDGQNKLG